MGILRLLWEAEGVGYGCEICLLGRYGNRGGIDRSVSTVYAILKAGFVEKSGRHCPFFLSFSLFPLRLHLTTIPQNKSTACQHRES